MAQNIGFNPNQNLSQSRNFNPTLGEAVIAAYSRCGIRRTELTQQHMADAEMEANLLQSEMQGDGINLYQVTLEVQDIVPGQSVYNIDPTIVFVLDVYIRQNSAPNGVQWANNNASSTVWTNNNDTNSVWYESLGYNPAVQPSYTFWANQNNIDSPWANSNGYIDNWSGYSAPVPIPPVPPTPFYTIPQNAIDRIIIPFSRSDYASVANKGMTGFPTSFWPDYLLQPTLTLWPVPNYFIPQGLQYYVQKRPTNAMLDDGSNIQIPYQAYDYFVFGLAERLAFIYAPDKVAMLGPRKQQAYTKYLQATTENVPIKMDVDVSSYYRVG
jgi:hypothetical protein